MPKVLPLFVAFVLVCLYPAAGAEINFNGLSTDQQLVGQNGWLSIYGGAGGKVKASESIPGYGNAQKTVATNGLTDPASGQFAKANIVSGLSSNGILQMDVLVQYQKGSPIRFAPAGDGITTAGASASIYLGPQLQLGYLTDGDNAKLLSGGASSSGEVEVDLPSTIGWLEWVWFRLELDCSETTSTGNVIATASYRNLSDGEENFSVIPGLVDIHLSVSGMAEAVEDPSTWTSVWIRHDNIFSAPGALAAIRVEQFLVEPQMRDIWSIGHSPLPTLSISATAITADLDRFYVVVVKPDQSAHVYAIDDQGSVLSTSQILGPAIDGVAGSGVREDAHNSFSIGIDPLGYLHVAGNHHNSAWNYWISDAPRSAASFTDHSTEHDVIVSGNSINDTNLGELWKNSKIGGWFATYPNFFRDNFGRLWLTARIIARDNGAVVEEGSLAGLRGGLLARYDTHDQKLWEPFGARAPSPGNTYRLPVITWDETGRASNVDEWYQGYRINLDFDSANDMHMAWVAYGSLAEGAPAGNVRNDGATHFNYMRRRDHDGAFLKPKGARATLPATRWESNLIYNNPGNFDFGTYVTTGEEDEPFFIYIEEGVQYLQRKAADGEWERVVIPTSRSDSGYQVLYHQDVGLIVTDTNRVLRSQDRGDSWEIIDVESFRQVDKAYFRRTGNLIGPRMDAGNTFVLHELRFNHDSTPIPADDFGFETRSDQTLSVLAPGVLGNDLHPLRSSSTVRLVTGPSGGDLILAADGGFTYAPDEGFAGQDTFVYEMEDSSGETAQAVAYITVHPPLIEMKAYEPFDVIEGSLGNGSGVSSYGFDGPWQQGYLDPSASPLTVGASSLEFDDSARGNHLAQDGDGTLENAYRKFDDRLRFSTGESHTRYLSFVAKVENAPTQTEQHFVYLVDRWGDAVAGFRRYDNNRVLCFIQGNAQQSVNSGQSNQHFDPWTGDWLIVLKIETHPTNPDTVYVKRYRVGDELVEPTTTGSGEHTWSVFASNDTDMTIEGIRIGIVDSVLAFDEIRVGGTFESVTSDLNVGGVAVLASQSNVVEADGNALQFQFSRSDSSGPLSVYYTVDGVARMGVDYETPSGVVDFTDGESVVATSFDVIDDTIPEASETVNVTLTADASYEIANEDPASAEILFNDLVDLVGTQFNQEEQTQQTATVRLYNPTDGTLEFSIGTELTQVLEYSEATSENVDGPAYDWIEISGTGTRLDALENNISEESPYNVLLDLGDFSFPYFGEPIEELLVSPHGVVFPNGGDWPHVNFRTHQNLENGLSYHVIAPMWTRIIVGDNSAVYYQLVDDENFIVQYENVQLYRDPDSRATFQIVINRAGSIRFNYRTDNIPNSEHKFTIGIKEKKPSGAQTGLGEYLRTYYAFTSVPSTIFVDPGKSIIYRVPQVWVSPDRNLVSVPAGESRTFDLSFFTYAFSGSHTEQGDVRISIPALTHDETYAFGLTVGAMSSTEIWRMDNFGHVFNIGDANDLKDPDFDGIVNLIEYGLGKLPKTADASGMNFEISPTLSTFSFMRAASDLDYVVESSKTLAPESWNEMIRNPGNPGEMIDLEMPTSADAEFYRLRLERP